MSVEHVSEGDVLVWQDPDGSLCSRRGTVAKVHYFGDNAVFIIWEGGGTTDAFLEELSYE